MAWPPPVPPATRANNSPQLDSHPSDHNLISAALTALFANVPQIRAAVANVTFSAGSAPVTFATPFTTACDGMVAIAAAAAQGAGNANVVNAAGPTDAGHGVVRVNTSFSGAYTICYIAWGH